MKLDQAVAKLRQFFRRQKRLPSYQEMCALFGFSSKHASFKLAEKLIQAKFLKKDERGHLLPDRLFPALPVLGVVTAGAPVSAEEQFLSSLSFDDYLINRPDKSYLLRVSGDSMIEAGIHEGDMVIVEKGREPKSGDIVVAFVDNEFTLKYFRRENNKVYLAPGNRKYPAIYPKDSLSVFGIVVSVIRKYH